MFPNAAALNRNELNLRLLDHRRAVEWVRSNIVEFGGDPRRITLWGHSASVSVDSYNFAYAKDLIVSGLIMSSGTAQSSIPLVLRTSLLLLRTLDADVSSADAELACMRDVAAPDIVRFLKQRVDNGTTQFLRFHH